MLVCACVHANHAEEQTNGARTRAASGWAGDIGCTAGVQPAARATIRKPKPTQGSSSRRAGDGYRAALPWGASRTAYSKLHRLSQCCDTRQHPQTMSPPECLGVVPMALGGAQVRAGGVPDSEFAASRLAPRSAARFAPSPGMLGREQRRLGRQASRTESIFAALASDVT